MAYTLRLGNYETLMSESQREKFDPPEIDPWRKEKTGKVSTVRALVQSKVALLIDRIWSIGHACFERIFPKLPVANEADIENNPRLALGKSLILQGRIEEGMYRFEQGEYTPPMDLLKQGYRVLLKQSIIDLIEEGDAMQLSIVQGKGELSDNQGRRLVVAMEVYREAVTTYERYFRQEECRRTIQNIIEEIRPSHGNMPCFRDFAKDFMNK